MCCQVEVSATSWSLVQRSPADCGDSEVSIMRRPWHNGGCSALLTYSMQQSPWEANRFSAGQEHPRIIWSLTVHYRINKRPLSVPILSQLGEVHTLMSQCMNTLINIILPSTPASPKWSLSLTVPIETVYKPLLSHIRATWPAHLILLERALVPWNTCVCVHIHTYTYIHIHTYIYK